MPARRRWWVGLARVAAAAVFLVGVGFASWMLRQPHSATAETVLDQMIEWNVALSQSDDAGEKTKLFKEKAKQFAALVKKGELPEDQQELAEKLLTNASWLAENEDDPLEEANRFNDLADEVVEKLSKAKDEKTINQLAESYTRLAEKGINANMQQLSKQKKLEAKQQEELKKLLIKEEQRLKKLQIALQQQRTAQAQKALKQAVSVTGNHPQKKKTTIKGKSHH
jgi:hypothetical protein